MYDTIAQTAKQVNVETFRKETAKSTYRIDLTSEARPDLMEWLSDDRKVRPQHITRGRRRVKVRSPDRQSKDPESLVATVNLPTWVWLQRLVGTYYEEMWVGTRD